MREIEFRGKTKNELPSRWIFGSLTDVGHKWFIDDYETNARVITETIGQYTGLKDKNERKIFDGDILIGDIPELLDSQNLIGIVEYEGSAFIVRIPNRKSWQIQNVGFCSFANYRVIGNIYDNPELLEVE